LLPAALAGARLLFVIIHWEAYRREPNRIWRRSEGGAALYGGLLVSLVASLPLLRFLGVTFWPFWDAATITMLVGMVFARIGCLLNGCCAGRPTEAWFGLCLPDTREIWRRRFPTQLLEAGLAGLLLLASVGLWHRLPFDGALFLFNLAGYSLGRCWLESTLESPPRIKGVALYQAISIVLAGLSVSGLVLALLFRQPSHL
jgi:phosphatidylglycerol:prolipoprotein diacylglycerol transferase